MKIPWLEPDDPLPAARARPSTAERPARRGRRAVDDAPGSTHTAAGASRGSTLANRSSGGRRTRAWCWCPASCTWRDR
jgi:hypothetical protein